jgi:hypothetical protein
LPDFFARIHFPASREGNQQQQEQPRRMQEGPTVQIAVGVEQQCEKGSAVSKRAPSNVEVSFDNGRPCNVA